MVLGFAGLRVSTGLGMPRRSYRKLAHQLLATLIPASLFFPKLRNT